MTALLFGSIGTIVETSELQHRAFNFAFEKHGLDWHWDRENYEEMLKVSGGVKRIEGYAARKGAEVDAKAIHATKTEIFLDLLKGGDVPIRPGVVDLLTHARDKGMKTGFVTGTEEATVEIVLGLLKDAGAPDFDVVTSRSLGLAEKPDPAIYRAALSRLVVDGKRVVVVEDNVDGVAAAKAAGLHVIGSPGAYAGPDDLAGADIVAEDLHAAGVDAVDRIADSAA